MIYQREMLGLSYQQVGKNLNVHASTVWRVAKQFREEGSVVAKVHHGNCKIGDAEAFTILESVLQYPAIYLKEIQVQVEELTGTTVSESAICRYLQRCNFSRKKLNYVAAQRSEELRSKFVEDCSLYNRDMLVFLDESGCNRRHAMRRFGYALKGQRARDVRLLCRGRRISAIAMITAHGLLDVHCTTDSVDEEVFCDAIERKLLPHLMPFDGINPQSVVVLDNCSIHHTRRATELIQSTGALVHFLPPYSPDLSPVEELFSKVKVCLRENDRYIELSDDRTLLDLVYAAFSVVTSDDCLSWFVDCGYT